MYSVEMLLEMAKHNKNLKSDRALARALELTSVGPYRTKGVIPDDRTALKLAELCDLQPEAVLASCHAAVAQKSGNKKLLKSWESIFNTMTKAAAIFVVFLGLFAQPTSVNAQPTFQNQSGKIYIMRH